ncbi:hypothetical protein EG68_08385 [Paragonimus skrjabini miyazakii]|uniref:CRC domain-containing protein n=1 Tax=Paragonimus skrjabini miyazakii TaxID=59628 RepID=A0A8S9YQB1_9TREM|nr:hypothetical protein EG68_08385 [Paragonimus skrjabini miyazakii]
MSEPFFDDRDEEYLINTLQKQKNIALAAEFGNSFVNTQEDDNILFTQPAHDFKFQSDENKLDDAVLSKLCSAINGTATYKKPCNCNKSHCLKLYCECFARGIACDNCNCSNCMNNVIHEEARRRAIKSTLERNPLAFHPKIGESDRKHSKGCNCKRSGCLKNYCECYEAKISCSSLCRCQGCRNYDNGCLQTNNAHLNSSTISKQKSAYLHKKSAVCFEHANSNVINGQLVRLPHANQAFGRYTSMHENLCPCSCGFDEPVIYRMPSGFLSMEVTEAACGCMLAQLDEAKQRSVSPVHQERVILEEFGKCLEQILESAAKVPYMSTYADAVNFSSGETMHDPDFITILSSTNSQNSHSVPFVNSEQVNHTIYTCDENSQSNLNLISRDSYAEPELGIANYSNLTDSSLAGHFTYPDSLTPATVQKHVELPVSETPVVAQPHSLSSVYAAEFMDQPVVRMLNMLDGTSEERPNTFPIINYTHISEQPDNIIYPNEQLQGLEHVAFYSGATPMVDNSRAHLVPNDSNGLQTNAFSTLANMPFSSTIEPGAFSHLFSIEQNVGRDLSDGSESADLAQLKMIPNEVSEERTDGAEEEEVQNATAALLHANQDYSSTGFAPSTQMDMNGVGELHLIESNYLASMGRLKESNSLVLLDPNEPQPFETNFGLTSDVYYHNINTHQTEVEALNDVHSLKSEVEFYDF